MNDSYASARYRADFADGLVTELERLLERIHSVRVNLRKQVDAKQGREIDHFTANPILQLLERADEPIRAARRLAVIEAYDQRRQPCGE